MKIRELNGHETELALKLVWEVFLEFEGPDYPQEGVNEFRSFLDNKKEMEKLRFFGALQADSVVGVLAMRKEHISLFFVKKTVHKNGIGKALFQHMLSQTGYEKITVNSSPYAQKIYEKPGFFATGSEQTANGIRYIPMTNK